jgi:hypothetical protein
MIGDINIYDAYRPCWQNNGNTSLGFSQMFKQAHRKPNSFQDDDEDGAPPCVDSEGIDALLNNDAHRQAMGIPSKVRQYVMCTSDKILSYDHSTTGSYWVYEKLVPLNKYRIVKYSGDSDPAVPYSGTLRWINNLRKSLHLATKAYWRPWYTTTVNGRQNSGALWELENGLSLFRFKGVGHMAPQWNNLGGTKLINYLLFNQSP